MRTTPALSPLFRSEHQGRLLAVVLIDPTAEYSVADLARRLGVNHATVSREVDRLERAGLFATRRLGSLRMVRADLGSPVAAEVRSLALKTFGPGYVLAQELSELEGIDEAWIYGSWAERDAGVQGPPPSDLDVMIVGAPDRNAVYLGAASAGLRLGVEVNATVRSATEWAAAGDGFLAKVRAGPLVAVPLAAVPVVLTE